MTESLRDAVENRRAEVAKAPARRTAFDTVRRNETVLRTIGLNPDDPKAQAVVAVCDRYGLDPVLGHIMILGASRLPYITRDGYLHIAHKHPQFDGLQVDDPHREAAEWVTHATVWRKDMTHPFTYPGSADVGRDNAKDMAIARSERRALKRAFAVTLPREFAEDEWDTRETTSAPPAPAPGPSSGDSSPPMESPGEANQSSNQGFIDAPLPGVEGEDYPDDYWDQPAPKNLRTSILAAYRQAGITERGARLADMNAILGRPADRPVKSTTELTLAEAETIRTALRDREYHADPDTEGGDDNDGSTVDEE